MRALAMFPSERELRIVEMRAPTTVGPTEVMVRIREVGVCGTDREILELKHGAPPQGSERLVLGHEAFGEVVAIGPDVKSLHVGDLVALTVRRPCNVPTCAACRAGRQDFCTTGAFRECGILGADGFMTELVVEDEHYVVPVPKALEEVGVLVEPLSVASKAGEELDAILRRYPWEPTRMRALVLGAGPIGLLAAMMLVAREVDVVMYSLEPADSERARMVESFGGTYVSARDVQLDELPRRIGKTDLIFEAVGHSGVAFGSLAALAPNGICIFSGLPAGAGPTEVQLDGIMRNLVLQNQVVLGTVNAGRRAFAAAVRQLEQFETLFPEPLNGLITERVTLEQAPELLRHPRGIKQVVTFAT
ncbi:MAG: glucose 1-dehydrogenase [Kofleriaceae bacterium]|nr:glucose 1-dehydrogenase [Kofleriaceae bacterium]